MKVLLNDHWPQHVCSECLPQIVTACNIKQTCIKSDKALKNQGKGEKLDEDFPLPIEEQAVKIESEPDIFHVDTINNKVKDEPVDEFDEYCTFGTPIDYDYLKFNDPMRSVREYSPEEQRHSPERKYKHKPSTSSRLKREPPPSSFKCYLCKEEFHQRKLKYEHLETIHINDAFKCRVCKHKSQTARGFDNHMMLHENPELLSHMCHICSSM